ncbi:MAG: hypothetical protein JWM85_1652 [Acidimicrobiaceae bacterium]|nr:hypothetical protein [Acidimicrobiaceae bacterium]
MPTDSLPRFENGGVVAQCRNCGGTVTRFSTTQVGGGYCTIQKELDFGDSLDFALIRCNGCGHGALAVLFADHLGNPPQLMSVHPQMPNIAVVPVDVPADLLAELREAEEVAGIGAFRAATALLRSTLEKTLKANGYTAGNLYNKIDAAAGDHVITAARKRQVHEDVRRIGNDVVHEDWRPVAEEEFAKAHDYVVWLLEDLYADRPTVVAELQTASRLDANGAPIS